MVLGKVQHQLLPIRPFPGQSFAVGHHQNIRSNNLFRDDDEVIRRAPLSFKSDDLEAGERTETSMAAELGSDVPFALHGGTALGTGRGEELATVLSRNTFHWVLAFGAGGLSAARVYAEIDRLERSDFEVPKFAYWDEVMQYLGAPALALLVFQTSPMLYVLLTWALGKEQPRLTLLPPMFLGILIGNRIHHGMSEVAFRRTVACALIASGLALLLK